MRKRPLLLALPKGRIQRSVFQLLRDAGLGAPVEDRGLRPRLEFPGLEAKLLKPRNIVEMLIQGSRDMGFVGRDLVAELDGELIEILDTELDPVRIVAAAPPDLLIDGRMPDRPLRVATEYPRLTGTWMERTGVSGGIVHSSGATEVFPPEDADLIVDNTQTGDTLRAHGLTIVDELLTSTTCLFASESALADDEKRSVIETVTLLIRSALEARRRVLLDVNAGPDCVDAVIDLLPAMRRPTISELSDGQGLAIRAAVPRADLSTLIPLIKARGGTDIVVTAPERIVP